MIPPPDSKPRLYTKRPRCRPKLDHNILSTRTPKIDSTRQIPTSSRPADMTMDEEKQSFLGGDRIDDEEPILHRPVRRWSLFHRIVYSPYTVHITMMLAYTLLFFVFIRMSICPSSKELQVIYCMFLALIILLSSSLIADDNI